MRKQLFLFSTLGLALAFLAWYFLVGSTDDENPNSLINSNLKVTWVNQNAEFFEAAQDLNHLELYLKSIRHPLAVAKALEDGKSIPIH